MYNDDIIKFKQSLAVSVFMYTHVFQKYFFTNLSTNLQALLFVGGHCCDALKVSVYILCDAILDHCVRSFYRLWVWNENEMQLAHMDWGHHNVATVTLTTRIVTVPEI